MASAERRDANQRLQVHYPLGDRMCSGDLVFVDGRPILVISWQTVDWKRVPYISVPLDAGKLKPSARPRVYVYEGDLTLAGKPVKPAHQD